MTIIATSHRLTVAPVLAGESTLGTARNYAVFHDTAANNYMIDLCDNEFRNLGHASLMKFETLTEAVDQLNYQRDRHALSDKWEVIE